MMFHQGRANLYGSAKDKRIATSMRDHGRFRRDDINLGHEVINYAARIIKYSVNRTTAYHFYYTRLSVQYIDSATFASSPDL